MGIGSPTGIRSPTGIGNPTGIERPTNVNNTFGNKKIDYLPYRNSEEIDHLLQIVRIQYITRKEAKEVVSKENPYIPEVQ